MRWKDLSISSKLYIVIGIMATLIAGELAALNFAMNTLSAVRAFVGGEGLWSKAQKNAAFYLQRYAADHNAADYKAFLSHLKIPEGDHQARMELQKPRPDLQVIREGFLQGGIHPDDIDPMVRLLRRFYWEPHLAKAIAAWTQGDVLLDEFKKAAMTYVDLSRSPHQNRAKLNEQLGHIQALNDRLTIIENEFSGVLGEGSRWMERVVISLLFLAVLTVETVGLTLTFFTSRSISQGLAQINAAAGKIGRGEFGGKPLKIDSRDEIGSLAHSINEMENMLKNSYQELEIRVQERTAELAKLASENAELYVKASAALKARDEFLSIASHELRTPLTALSLQMELFGMKVRGSLSGPALESLEQALQLFSRHVERLVSLSNELMDLTRIRSGKFDLQKKKSDLAALTKEVVGQYVPEAAKVGSTITVVADKPVWGEFDPTRILQVISNLVSNAVKYGDGKAIRVEVSQGHNRAILKVSDQGKGIAPEAQARIFDYFERAHADKGIPGLGLGLYIARQIVEAHKGTLSVQSAEGKGSTFTVTIPV